MPSFEFTSPEGKKYTVAGPEGATKEQAFAVLQQQIAGGTAREETNPQLAGVPGMDPAALGGNRNAGIVAPRSFGDKLEGGIETGLALATGAIGGTLGMAGGAIKGLAGAVMDGKFGTQAGVRQVEDNAAAGMQALTYAPRTEAGQEYTGKVGEVLAETIPAMGLSSEMSAIGRGAAQASKTLRGAAAASNAPINAADAALAAAPKTPLRALVKKPVSSMAGVGAAETSKVAQRAQRFEQFGIKPTEGQLTRDKGQVKFEREIAKTEEGKSVSDHFDEQNAQVERVFNQMADETGAAVTDLREVGQSGVGALEAKSGWKLGKVRDEYKAAREAGEMMEPVDVTNLATFVKANKGKDKIAPIVSMIEAELKQNSKEVGGNLDKLTLTPTKKRVMMTLDAAEDLRQAINSLAEPGTPNKPMGLSAIKVLDKATEGKGGSLYQQARRGYENYMKEFGDHDVIDKLLRTKPGTKDRAVAFEAVVDDAILKRSRDEVRHLFRALEAHAADTPAAIVEAGQQAARDLRGAFVNHIRDKMFSNGGADSFGNVVGSQKKILDVVTKYQRNGVLRAVLGKEGERMMLDLRDLATDIYTVPAGVVNTSGNEAAIVRALDQIHNKVGGLPAAGYVTKHVRDHVKQRTTAKKVEKALNPKQAVRPQNNF